MIRDKKFFIDSIKMDLFRIVTATGDLTKSIPRSSIKEFLEHAYTDFEKIDPSTEEQALKSKLKQLSEDFPYINDPKKRLKWTEDILTIRCML